jgi:hypothetical protein
VREQQLIGERRVPDAFEAGALGGSERLLFDGALEACIELELACGEALDRVAIELDERTALFLKQDLELAQHFLGGMAPGRGLGSPRGIAGDAHSP